MRTHLHTARNRIVVRLVLFGMSTVLMSHGVHYTGCTMLMWLVIINMLGNMNGGKIQVYWTENLEFFLL